MSLDPARAFGFAQRASVLVALGRPADALTYVDRAQSLAEQRIGFVWLQRCRAQMALGQYRESIASCQKSVSTEDSWMQHAYLASAYALVGDDDAAKNEMIALNRLYPNVTIRTINAIGYSNVAEYLRQQDAHWYRGLRKAGIAEG